MGYVGMGSTVCFHPGTVIDGEKPHFTEELDDRSGRVCAARGSARLVYSTAFNSAILRHPRFQAGLAKGSKIS